MTIINFQKAEFKNKNPPIRPFGVVSVFADPPSLSFLRQGYEGTSYGGQAILDARYEIRASFGTASTDFTHDDIRATISDQENTKSKMTFHTLWLPRPLE